MARHLFFLAGFIGIAFLHSPASAELNAIRCEDRAANCVGRCTNPGRRNERQQMHAVLRPAGRRLFGART